MSDSTKHEVQARILVRILPGTPKEEWAGRTSDCKVTRVST